MKNFILAFLMTSSFGIQVAFAEVELIETSRAGSSWDLNVDFGAGNADQGWKGFGRVRAGFLRVGEPDVFAYGPFLDYLGGSGFSFGAQAEYLHLTSGVWLQTGGIFASKQGLGALASVGWSLFGFEIQRRGITETPEWMSLLKLRIPIGVIFALKGK